MKKLILMAFVAFLAIGMLACQPKEGENNNSPEVNNEENNPAVNDEEVNENESNDQAKESNKQTEGDKSEADETEPEKELTQEDLGEIHFTALKEKDLETIASYTHPKKGLLITPYVYIVDGIDSFTKEEVKDLLKDDEIYNWGIYDGKGTPIELSGEDYFEEFIDTEILRNKIEVFINNPQTRGNTFNNIDEVFNPDLIIEYHYEGSEEYAGIDWESINFVFVEEEDNLYLVAIVGDSWTV